MNGKIYSKYSSASMYLSLLDSHPRVQWSTVVWPLGGIPRHSFLCWLVTLDCCPTRDRMIKWGLNVSPTCLLCNTANESRDHLFFQCDFLDRLLALVTRRCGFLGDQSCDGCLNNLIAYQGTNCQRKLCLLAWQACIYFIWSERNNRLHRNIYRTHDAVFSLLDSIIRNMIAT